MYQRNARCIQQTGFLNLTDFYKPFFHRVSKEQLRKLFFAEPKKQRVINLVFPNADSDGAIAERNKWMMELVNSDENAFGEYAKIVIGHAKQKQGFDVKNGVCLHMITVPTSKQTFEQIKRRILRFCSFSGQIKKKGMKMDNPVEIKLYVQVPPVSETM